MTWPDRAPGRSGRPACASLGRRADFRLQPRLLLAEPIAGPEQVDTAVAFPQDDADREPADGEERGTLLAAAGSEIGRADRGALAAGDEVAQRDQVLAQRDRKPHRQAVH